MSLILPILMRNFFDFAYASGWAKSKKLCIEMGKIKEIMHRDGQNSTSIKIYIIFYVLYMFSPFLFKHRYSPRCVIFFYLCFHYLNVNCPSRCIISLILPISMHNFFDFAYASRWAKLWEILCIKMGKNILLELVL